MSAEYIPGVVVMPAQQGYDNKPNVEQAVPDLRTVLLQVTDPDKFNEFWHYANTSLVEDESALELAIGARVMGLSREDLFARTEEQEANGREYGLG